jgi:hypothetical protein
MDANKLRGKIVQMGARPRAKRIKAQQLSPPIIPFAFIRVHSRSNSIGSVNLSSEGTDGCELFAFFDDKFFPNAAAKAPQPLKIHAQIRGFRNI